MINYASKRAPYFPQSALFNCTRPDIENAKNKNVEAPRTRCGQSP
jgi:hypothetical protein